MFMKKYVEMGPYDVTAAIHGVSQITDKDELAAIGKNNLAHLLQHHLQHDAMGTAVLAQTSPRCEKYAAMLDAKREFAAVLTYLFDLLDDAEEKPYIPIFRPDDWFSAGERVKIFVKDIEGVLPEYVGTLVSGTEIEFWDNGRYIDVRADVPFRRGDYLDGCGLRVSLKRPEILQKWEYNYLREHPDFLEVWLRCVENSYRDDRERFDPEAFRTALNA